MNRLEVLLSYYALDPQDPFNIYALALEYRSANQIDKAIELLETLHAQNPDYVATYYQLAKLLELQNRHEEAENIYIEGMKVSEKANDRHTYQELKNALQMMMDDLL